MTLTHSDRLALPLLAAGQAQKEIVHNEALMLLDMLSQPVVQSADLSAPPGSPAPGQCWIVAASPTGDWAGRAGALAAWTEAGWRFAPPGEGWSAWVADRGQVMRFDGTSWADEQVRADGYYIEGEKTVGEQQPAIADPTGGATVDGDARAAIIAVLAALRSHGLIAT